MLPKMFEIKRIKKETPRINTYFFEGDMSDYKPGQFIMLWLPGVGEKPFAISYNDRDKREFGVSIRNTGEFTDAIRKVKKGTKLGIRGPFGRGFTINKDKGKNIAVVAGGIGMIALSSLIEELDNPLIVCGAKNKDELVFAKRFKTECCTDDGSQGPKCFAPELFESMLKAKKIDFVYTCGPEPMIKATHDLCRKYKIPMEAALERYMKCGIGVCASCVCGDKLVCKDGPVFNDKELDKMGDFGKNALLKSGRNVSLKEYYGWNQK